MTQRTTTTRSARCAMGLTCLLTGTLSLSSFAQDSLQVTFVGDRELELREVTKPNSNPQRVDLGMEKPTISYEPVVKSISPKTETEDIQPLAVKMDAPLPRLYAGYAKGGFGLYTSPLLDIHFGETQSRNGAWGVNLMHKSSAGSTGQPDSLNLDEGWSHNLATGYYRRFIDKSSLTLDGGVDRQAWGLHGLDLSRTQSGDFSAPSNRQTYARTFVNGRLQNHERDSAKVHRDIQLQVSRLAIGATPWPAGSILPEAETAPMRENLLTTRGHLHSAKDGALYDLQWEGHFIGSSVALAGDSVPNPVQRNAALIGAVPSVTKERGAYRIRVGAGLWLDARGRQGFHFYPTAEVRFRLLDDVFVPYGGVDGGMQRNAIHDLIEANPWFDAGHHANSDAPRGALQHTNRALELYGGVRGKLTRDLSFNAQARTTRFRDFGYWVNEAGPDSAGQRFGLAYDSLTVASVIGEAMWRGQGALELNARAEFHTYGTGDQPYAWYQPRTRISASGRWNLEDLLFLNVGMEIVGARYAPSRVPFGETIQGETSVQAPGESVGQVFGDGEEIFARKLSAYTALDLGIEYRYNGRLAMGIDAKGPLGNTQIFNGYNAQNFRVMMWAGYRF